MSRRLVVALAVLLGGCVVQELDLEGRACPCVAGWHCDDGICVEGAPMEGDAGWDAAEPDAGGVRDAGPPRSDGGPEDAGRVDAAPVDAGFDGGPPPDPTACDDALAGAILCDGFEVDDGFGAWTPGAAASDGTIERVTDVAYRGSAALRAQTAMPSGRAWLGHDIPVTTDGTLWLRAYVRVPEAADITHFDVLGVRAAVDPFDGVVVAMRDRTFLYVHESSMAYGMAPLPARADWVCMELEVAVSDTAGEIRLYMDGALEVEATGIDTLPAGGHQQLGVGLLFTSSLQGATTVLFDEVALGTARLPCDG